MCCMNGRHSNGDRGADNQRNTMALQAMLASQKGEYNQQWNAKRYVSGDDATNQADEKQQFL